MTNEVRNPNDEMVRVRLGERSYEIAIVTGDLPAFAKRLSGWLAGRGIRDGSRSAVLIVTDRNVCETHATVVGASLHLAGFRCEVAVLEPGEQTKSLESAALLYDRLVEMQADRRTIVVAVGG